MNVDGTYVVMADEKDLASSALWFVDLLTPGNFEAAKGWISSDCEYLYGDGILKGEAIIQSFIDNHTTAVQKLDRIEYQKGEVESIVDRTVSVLVSDRIWVKGRTHDYHDRLIVTFGQHTGPNAVVRIENRRVDGERDKLLRFFESCGLEWK